jgi:hypothetical protein
VYRRQEGRVKAKKRKTILSRKQDEKMNGEKRRMIE